MPLRLKAFWLHLSVSALLLSVFACLVLFLWYTPWPLLSLQGGIKVLGLMVLIDVILGPSFTLLVFKPEKSRRMLIFDMLAIVVVQVVAFGYGAWMLYSERPLFLAFVIDKFEVVRGPDINLAALDNSVAVPANVNGAQWVRVDIPDALLFRQFLSHQLKSPGMELKPEYYRPLLGTKPEVLAKYALPMQEIKAKEQTKTWLQEHQLTADKVWLLPINGRAKQGIAILAADTGVPLGLVAE